MTEGLECVARGPGTRASLREYTDRQRGLQANPFGWYCDSAGVFDQESVESPSIDGSQLSAPKSSCSLAGLWLPGIMVPRNFRVRRSSRSSIWNVPCGTHCFQPGCLLPDRSSSSELVCLPKRLDQFRNYFGRFSLAGAYITDTQERMQKAGRAASRAGHSPAGPLWSSSWGSTQSSRGNARQDSYKCQIPSSCQFSGLSTGQPAKSQPFSP